MDQTAFDRMAKVLGAAASRRSGLMAALGAALGGATLGATAGAARRGRAGNRRPSPEGPCGNGSRKDNVCARDSQCCTGFCQKGIRNKDGKGRCRCIRKGQPCKPSQTCCKGACTDGRCGEDKNTAIATGQPCNPASDTCAEAAASCVGYELGAPTGTYCLLPNGSACSGNTLCESNQCASGVCATSCTVCADGCPYTKIADAFNVATPGTVISIAPGDYLEAAMHINSAEQDNLTLRRCGSAGTVSLTNATDGDSYLVYVEGAYSLALENLDFYSIPATMVSYAQLWTKGDYTGVGAFCTVTVTGCTFRDMTDSDSYGAVALDGMSNATFTGCLFEGNRSNGNGAGIGSEGWVDAPAKRNVLTVTDCIFRNNEAGETIGSPSYDGGGLGIKKTNATVTGCTFTGNAAESGGAIIVDYSSSLTVTDSAFTGNSATDEGGAILVVPYGSGAQDQDISVVIAGSTTFTGNSTVNGGSAITVRGVGASNIWSVTGAAGTASGNTGGAGQCAYSTNNGSTWTVAPNCVFP